MLNRVNKIYGILVLTLVTLTVVFFQNCAKTEMITDKESNGGTAPEVSFAFFHYDYKQKPILYGNLALIFPAESMDTLEKFNFYGMLTPADGSGGPISYSVSITDDSGATVCVGDSGFLEENEQIINFECLGSSSLEKAIVTVRTIYQDQEEIFRATFTKEGGMLMEPTITPTKTPTSTPSPTPTKTPTSTPTPTPTKTPSPDVVAGEALYKLRCLSCHDAKTKFLTKHPAVTSDLIWSAINGGIKNMETLKFLTRTQVDQIGAYLKYK